MPNSLKTTCNLQEFLANPDSYSELNLYSNKSFNVTSSRISEAEAKELVKALRVNRTLTQLDLRNNGIGDIAVTGLMNALQFNHTLTNLDLGNNLIRDAGIMGVATAIRSNSTLVQLNLAGRNDINFPKKIGESALEEIVQALKVNKTLTQLNLSTNNIGPVKAISLVASLPRNLTELTLSNNQIGNVGILGISTALQVNQTLIRLNLSNNQIESSGALGIAIVLEVNNTLTQLELDRNKLGEEGAVEIATALTVNRSLKYLGLGTNQIKTEGAKELALALKQNQTLQSLSLDYNHIGDSGAGELALALKENQTLTQLSWQNYSGGRTPIGVEIEKLLNKNRLLVDSEAKSDERVIREKAAERAENKLPIRPQSISDNVLFSKKFINQTKLLINTIDEGKSQLNTDKIDKVILLFGKTGTGKSSLTNLLLNVPLIAVHDPDTYTLTIETAVSSEIKISHQQVSEIKLPNKGKIGRVTIYDCPGFDDTDILQEIANIFYLQEIVNLVKQLKLVLVVDDAELTNNRGVSFLESVGRLTKMFNQVEQFGNSLALVATHAPDGKLPLHLSNILERITVQNNNLDAKIHFILQQLAKSAHLFYAPSQAGPIIPQSLLTEIENNSGYYSLAGKQNIVNLTLSPPAREQVKLIFNQLGANINNLILIVKTAILAPEEYLDDQNNSFSKNYTQLVLPWLSAEVKVTEPNKEGLGILPQVTYFPEIILLKKCFILLPERDFGQIKLLPAELVVSLISSFSEIALFANTNTHVQMLQNYTYFAKQQFHYLEFFGKLAEQTMPSSQEWFLVFSSLKKEIEVKLQETIFDINLEPAQETAYYQEALEYLKLYKHPLAQQQKAKAFCELGHLASAQSNNFKQTLSYYLEAIKFEHKLPAIYETLANILFDKGEYESAVTCCQILANVDAVESCLDAWIAVEPTNYTIRMQKGDYLRSVGLYEGAKKSYYIAKDLAKDKADKATALNKIADLLENVPDLAESLRANATRGEFEDFSLVTEEFIGHLTEIADQEAELVPLSGEI